MCRYSTLMEQNRIFYLSCWCHDIASNWLIGYYEKERGSKCLSLSFIPHYTRLWNGNCFGNTFELKQKTMPTCIRCLNHTIDFVVSISGLIKCENNFDRTIHISSIFARSLSVWNYEFAYYHKIHVMFTPLIQLRAVQIFEDKMSISTCDIVCIFHTKRFWNNIFDANPVNMSISYWNQLTFYSFFFIELNCLFFDRRFCT